MNYDNIAQLICDILREDIGSRDITTELTIPKSAAIKAILLTKEDCVVCGLGICQLVFKTQDKRIKFKPVVQEGVITKKGQILAKIEGSARSILTAERVALNFISFLSGVATKTREYVQAVKPYRVKIIDTRKTIPGLRILEKYAVRIGGGYNHRMSLDEMVLIKDNHIKILRNFKKLSKLPRRAVLEIEVKNLREFREALKLRPDIIMLDNMSTSVMREAVRIRNRLCINCNPRRPQLEASGGINLKNIKKVAACRVDMISIGALTHSVKSTDISLEVL
jgi:nicotinate-nucleotide pyrophosphorylase (carboxylating)